MNVIVIFQQISTDAKGKDFVTAELIWIGGNKYQIRVMGRGHFVTAKTRGHAFKRLFKMMRYYSGILKSESIESVEASVIKGLNSCYTNS